MIDLEVIVILVQVIEGADEGEHVMSPQIAILQHKNKVNECEMNGCVRVFPPRTLNGAHGGAHRMIPRKGESASRLPTTPSQHGYRSHCPSPTSSDPSSPIHAKIRKAQR